MAVSTEQSIRTFVAIALEPGLVTELKKVQQQLGAQLPVETVRWVRPEQLHLTLKFLGRVSRASLNDLAAALQRACSGFSSFRLTLEKVGCFPNTANPRVVWIGIHGELESLRNLQTRIERETQAFGDHSEDRAFRPHLTIGRVKAQGKGAGTVGGLVERAEVSKLGDWTVRQVHLIQSDLSPAGARYTTLATVGFTH